MENEVDRKWIHLMSDIAARSGDAGMLALCERALAGDEAAWNEVVATVKAAVESEAAKRRGTRS